MTPVVSRRFGRTGIRAICAAFGMVVTALTATLAATGANAHEIRPAVITADLATPGRFSITVSANLEALIAGIGAEHKDTDDAPGSADYKQLRSLSADDLRRRFDAFSGRWLADLGIGFDGVKVVTTVDAVTVPVNIDPSPSPPASLPCRSSHRLALKPKPTSLPASPACAACSSSTARKTRAASRRAKPPLMGSMCIPERHRRSGIQSFWMR